MLYFMLNGIDAINILTKVGIFKRKNIIYTVVREIRDSEELLFPLLENSLYLFVRIAILTLSTIFLLDFETVPTVWYYMFF